ncbi:MAG: hypothetical protein R2788_17025 [Saprospiraceae bacterium]
MTIDTRSSTPQGHLEPDGNITVSNVVGGTAPYTYLWVTGDTTPSLGGIPPGEYALSVTDSLGCETVFTFLVDFEVAAGELLEGVALTFLPNPVAAGGDMTLHIGGAAATTVTARLLDVAGRQAWSKVLDIRLDGGSFGFVAPSVPGMYWLVLEDGDGRRTVLKWIVH